MSKMRSISVARLSAFAILPLLAALFAAGRGVAQAPAKRPEFEVASIKPARNCLQSVGLNHPGPGRLLLSCISLKSLVWTAYARFDGPVFSSTPFSIEGGDGWMSSEYYSISAKAEGNPSVPEMAGPMLQVLLEGRFHLRLHKEPRDTAVYALALAGGKPKLQPLPEGSCAPFDMDALVAARDAPSGNPPGMCSTISVGSSAPDEPMLGEGFGLTMTEFAGRVLRSFTDRPVIDKTGLGGRFNFRLEAMRIASPSAVTPESSSGSPLSAADPPRGPSVFEALQKQYGLKLVPARAPVDAFVIDHAERPSEN